METAQIRRTFLDYFARHDHEIVPSSPLVPRSDPTLMFTNAGMVQFKDAFLGLESRRRPRAAGSQKCIRISGKHNDLENVGRTSRHHTFFEMLGNFSFGDYFKREAILRAWDLLAAGYGLPPDRLLATVFEDDDEAVGIWIADVGLPESRVLRRGTADNFWAMGETGPCGPCSEILIDRGEAYGPADPDNGERFFELWNLVFMQYERREPGGPLLPLPRPSIDTGMGLERLASVLQGVDSNYDIDVLRPLIARAAAIAGKRYGSAPHDDVSMRVIADHARMAAFLIAEGVFPDKSGREYVLRRVMRRAVRHGHRLGIPRPFLHEVALDVVDLMAADYPELAERRALIGEVVQQEENRFRATLERGLDLLASNDRWIDDAAGRRLPGEVAFRLYDTCGFPLDLVEVIGAEQGFGVDRDGFDRAMEAQRERSVWRGSGERKVAAAFQGMRGAAGPTAFVGHETDEAAGVRVVGIVRDGERVAEAREGEGVAVAIDRTPFYGEAGGQVGDAGIIEGPGVSVAVEGASRPLPDLIVHSGRVVSGTLREGAVVRAAVDSGRRAAIRRNHTATHLLHRALREVLGPHAAQKGSHVAHDRLRFDYSHFAPLSPEEIRRIEELVNREIVANHGVTTEVTGMEAARRAGAVAIFEEKYGDSVRMVRASPASLELCGGTHAARTGDIGLFKVLSDGAVAAGVRRIEAATGPAAVEHVLGIESALASAADLLRAAPMEVPERVRRLLAREKEAEREIADLRRRLAGAAVGPQDGGGRDVRVIAGVKVAARLVPVGDPAVLRDVADRLRQEIGSGLVALAGVHDGKANILVATTPDVRDRLRAGDIVREIAAVVGARGGGKPDIAQAGGGDPRKLDEAIERVYSIVAARLERDA
ncbi:MAG: alanine--tRNA ligase [Myxococcota bacterium]|nr:alanine--tRNA ligase [Myxococcota bacterium]